MSLDQKLLEHSAMKTKGKNRWKLKREVDDKKLGGGGGWIQFRKHDNCGAGI